MRFPSDDQDWILSSLWSDPNVLNQADTSVILRKSSVTEFLIRLNGNLNCGLFKSFQTYQCHHSVSIKKFNYDFVHSVIMRITTVSFLSAHNVGEYSYFERKDYRQSNSSYAGATTTTVKISKLIWSNLKPIYGWECDGWRWQKARTK